VKRVPLAFHIEFERGGFLFNMANQRIVYFSFSVWCEFCCDLHAAVGAQGSGGWLKGKHGPAPGAGNDVIRRVIRCLVEDEIEGNALAIDKLYAFPPRTTHEHLFEIDGRLGEHDAWFGDMSNKKEGEL
jgi:hypothetical protein